MGERRFVVGACSFGREVGLGVSIFVRRDECENLSAIFDDDKLLSFALFRSKKSELAPKRNKKQTNINTTDITRAIIRNDDVIISNNFAGSELAGNELIFYAQLSLSS